MIKGFLSLTPARSQRQIGHLSCCLLFSYARASWYIIGHLLCEIGEKMMLHVEKWLFHILLDVLCQRRIIVKIHIGRVHLFVVE